MCYCICFKGWLRVSYGLDLLLSKLSKAQVAESSVSGTQVNVKMTPIAYVIRLFLYLYSRQAFLTKVVSFYKQPIRGSVDFVYREKYPCTGRTATLCRIVICTSVNTTWRTAGLIQDFMECAEHLPTFFTCY